VAGRAGAAGRAALAILFRAWGTTGRMQPTEPTELLRTVTFDAQGLVPAIAQDALTGEVRMLAYMNREALEQTVRTGVATFWSRSRAALWIKGETSGHTLVVRELLLDCDGDCVLLRVEPRGPSCHTGAPSCFFRAWHNGSWTDGARPLPEVDALWLTLDARRREVGAAGRSYTRQLLDAGVQRIGEKLREEADELARALEGEPDDRVSSEAADVLFHTLVGLVSRGVSWRAVLAVLAKRRGVSGLTEKASRAVPNA
jgi:phosphoribosyl-AMP cyclohydrolase / phosphoribosyl-ATP pyrophosphohydrolase